MPKSSRSVTTFARTTTIGIWARPPWRKEVLLGGCSSTNLRFQVATETISGYETTKYAVDTIHQSQLEKSPGLIGGQLKDYNIVGTAWVAKQGACVLQYQIDYEEDAKDGTVRKVHYEGSITK
jgi:hypothetical protein